MTKRTAARGTVGASGFLLAFALAPLALRADEARQAEQKELSLTLSVGGQFRQDLKRLDAKFQEYSEVPRGALFESARLEWNPAGEPWSLSLKGRNILRLDQQYTLDVKQPGAFTLKASWTQIPHLFSRGATFLLRGSAGDYSLSDAFRLPLETAAGATPATIAALMPEVLRTSAEPIDLSSRRDIAEGELSFKLTEGLDVTLNARREKRAGTRAISTGTYIRRQAVAGEPATGPGFFDRERFEPRGIELPQPIDHRITDVGISATYSGKRGVASAGWQGSWFSNRVDTLFWNNPFEASPSAVSSIAGLLPQFDQEPPAPLGNAANRGRYARAALDLWPDNTYYSFFGSGSLRLPARTRIHTTLSVGRMRQDDPFLPYTENEAVVFSDPDGVPGSGDEVPAKDLARPAANLDGEIRTSGADLRVSSRPADPLTLHANLRWYDYDNRSLQIFFPGYASAGDSYFRRGIGQTVGGAKALFNNLPGYSRIFGDLGASYRVNDRITLEGEYARTVWDYDARQVDKTTEDTFRLGLRLEPAAWMTAHLTWLDGSRDFDGPYAVDLEISGVRAFDVWRRNRSRYSAEVDFDVRETWTLGLAGSYWKDEFPGAVEDFTQPYGLSDTKNVSVSGSVTYAKGRWSLGASAGYETDDWRSLQVTKSSLTAIDYDPINRWTREEDDKAYWCSINLRAEPTEKIEVSADLAFNRYTGDWVTANLATPTINSAVAYPFPQFKESVLTTRLSLRWELTRQMDFEARYAFEPYRLDDFTWDVLQPYMQGILQETGRDPAAVRAANVNRLLWLDSRYSDYTGHVVTAMIHVSF